LSSEGPFTKTSVVIAVLALIVSYIIGAAQFGWPPFKYPLATTTITGQASPGVVVVAPPVSGLQPRPEYSGPTSETASAQNLADFVITYYRLMPDTAAGWPLIGPNLRTRGEASYNRFWGRFSSAEVLGAPSVDGAKVTVRIALHPRDGTTTLTERHLLTVVRYDGELRIDGDKYLGLS